MAHKFSSNPQRDRHMTAGMEAKPSKNSQEKESYKGDEEERETASGADKPHVHVHPHDKGVTVHVMHSDGRHEKHEHAKDDVEGVKAHMDQCCGGGEGEGENADHNELDPFAGMHE